ELAVGALKVAFDGVVLEVVDGLGLVLHVVVAGWGGRCGRFVLREHRARRSRQSHPSEESETDDEWLRHDSVLLVTGGRLLGVRQPKASAVPTDSDLFSFF